MAEVEEPKFNSLAERIAALNQQKNFSAPPPVTKRPPPPRHRPPRPRMAQPTRQRRPRRPPFRADHSRENRRLFLGAQTHLPPSRRPSAPPRPRPTVFPALPTRSNTLQPSPALPPRRPSGQLSSGTRRGSNASDVSQISAVSTYSLSRASTHASSTAADAPQPRRVLPPTLDQTKLPTLPPSRKEREAEAARIAAESFISDPAARPKPSLVSIKSAPDLPVSRPNLPPRLPSRPAKSPAPPQDNSQDVSAPRRLPPPASAFVRPKSTFESSRPLAARPNALPATDAPPPPVPTSSRPTAQQLEAVAKKAAALQAASCLICRDFSRPDAVAAQFPRESLPRQDPIGYLANVLCGSFASETDKARAIFTWCHHNIAYDVEAFFGNNVKYVTPEDTIFRGMGVCAGYADVFKHIAERAGLQVLMVTGHGKGGVYLKDGERPPPKMEMNHAWNAVRIDNGEWKLLDACWGAGNVGNQQFTKRFAPERFTQSNEQFGLDHFPEDIAHLYRSDGHTPTWHEYMVGPTGSEMPHFFGGDDGFSKHTFAPQQKKISVYSGETVRFQISKNCEHFDFERHGGGKPFPMFVAIHGVDGRKDDEVLLQTDGFWWWADIPARDLGAPGQKIHLNAMIMMNNESARGVTQQQYATARKNKTMRSWQWKPYCEWELV
ncbi:kyphoscoliosis peptidase [Microdochium nivale]|nr:kyphoscoliosis peptidase [Microdochium nivale]